MIQLRINRICTYILSVLFIASIFAMPYPANAGFSNVEIDVPRTDDASDRLIGYWDLRDRQSYFQVTNTSGAPISVHIQIFDAENNCFEFDYFDDLTPRDTHVYNVADLDRNNGAALAAPDFTDGHGIIAVSVVPFEGNDNVITGNFRIFDNAGYEYRTNMAGEGFQDGEFPEESEFIVKFNAVDGSSFADLVVITYDTDDDTIFPTLNVWQPTIFDENENPISCSPVLLGCFTDIGELSFFPEFSGFNLNVGINQAVTNSRGAPSICLGSDTVGYLELDGDAFPNGIDSEEGAIFLGLNNGSSTGSIDHAIGD